MKKKKLKKRIKQLEELCGEAYQMVGHLMPPVSQPDDKQLIKALNNLGAGASGEDIPHKSFLPTSGKKVKWARSARRPNTRSI